ncbi:DNA circularization N-terminal domain-containing protein [Teichococcus aestuarii]|uniref:DNA circularization N-terminal domain-containing protein n=1 Tax=Teichococcus aestuarii TaxID=568898 RepID=UPI00361C630B
MSWQDALRPATWRGLPFAVWHTDTQVSRRVAPHEYPYRDTAWVEDLGRGMRRLSVLGFLVGDDCLDQQDRMIEAAEREGPGELMHPTLGLRQVSLVNLATTSRHDLGRVVELSFQFLEAGERVYPEFGQDGLSSILAAADAADQAAAGDFAAQAGAALRQGAAAADQRGARCAAGRRPSRACRSTRATCSVRRAARCRAPTGW